MTLLEHISDGLLPKDVVDVLDTNFFKVYDTGINGWSMIHFIVGFITGFIVSKSSTAFIVHCVWEAFQFIAGDNKFDFESLLDISFDTIFFMLGFWLNQFKN